MQCNAICNTKEGKLVYVSVTIQIVPLMLCSTDCASPKLSIEDSLCAKEDCVPFYVILCIIIEKNRKAI